MSRFDNVADAGRFAWPSEATRPVLSHGEIHALLEGIAGRQDHGHDRVVKKPASKPASQSPKTGTKGKVIHAPRTGEKVAYIKMSYMPYAGARRPG